MHKIIVGFIFSVLLVFASIASESPQTIVTAKPIYGLVASIMGNTGKPHLLLKGTNSPHQTVLSPAMVSKIQNAQLVFWLGPSIEPYMERALSSDQEGSKSVSLDKVQGLEFLEAREGGNWEHHDHDDHKHEEIELDKVDPHFWLSIDNAIKISNLITLKLGLTDPSNSTVYNRNGEKLVASLENLKSEIEGQLAQSKNKPFLVFHDAYQYFEKDFGLNAIGSVAVDAERQPGAKRIRALRKRIGIEKISCLFREPQFPAKIINVLTENQNIRVGVLDPIGSSVKADRNAYHAIMLNLAGALSSCLDK